MRGRPELDISSLSEGTETGEGTGATEAGDPDDASGSGATGDTVQAADDAPGHQDPSPDDAATSDDDGDGSAGPGTGTGS